ncbi:helix-turn-helix domain-containing protein [Jejuia spongiicola]|uniref:Helix-turn-helix domain-containing protein n=1 Tax=Jejuia spongiicola TaxID=2942207 RepID=A0ABT0QC58_9FLAO|nr:helix-turn-helix domain-containing protein [Jejuia spongiicola]MCL6294068.1 helix-turn-helix domain-containing protein [Jejuia spongiicola]
MLKTIQIIALIQGLFLLFILFKKRKIYKKPTFWLLVGSIVSILLFIIGDDDNNLLAESRGWFLFDSSLFITFLFLFFKYFKSDKEKFNKKDFFFFLPNIIYFIIEIIELFQIEEILLIELFEKLIEVTFLAYLIYIIIDLFKNKSKYWILYLTVPITLLMGVNYVNDCAELIGFNEVLTSNDTEYQSYFLIIIAFLFYGITYYLIVNPKALMPISKLNKYKGSNLNKQQIESYKITILDAMKTKELYIDPKLSIHKLSQEINIPRQYISEVLNIHLGKSFQDFVNEYRVEAFVTSLKKDQNEQFTLFGLANEVGFNSKSNFNAIFKKHKGLTPSQFKKTLI